MKLLLCIIIWFNSILPAFTQYGFIEPIPEPLPSQVRYYVRNGNEISAPLNRAQLEEWSKDNNKTPKNVFMYTHGYMTSSLKSSGAEGIKDAVLKNMPDVDVVAIVDWRVNSATTDYQYAANTCTSYVASDVAEELKYLHNKFNTNMQDITLAGHSLGAHVMGKAARLIKEKYGLGEIGIIIGLDPAGPLVYHGLTKSDASEVELIHTSKPYGAYKEMGHKDTFLTAANNDRIRACESKTLDDVCKHGAVTDIFQDKLNGINITKPMSTNATATDPAKASLGPLYIFVLDVSGSMNEFGRNVAMISSTKNTIKSLRINSSIAIVIFGGYASISLQPTLIRNEASRLTALAAVPNLGTNLGWTSIGAGLQAGYSLMDKSCVRQNTIVLLTDGDENRPPFIKDVKPPAISCFVVNSIAVGATADQGLENLSLQSGGKVSSVSDLGDNKQQLLEAMKSSTFDNHLGGMNDNSLLSLPPKFASVGGAPTRFMIDEDMTQGLNFFIDTSNYNQLKPRIITPSGENVANICKADADLMGFFCKFEDEVQPGEWKVSLSDIIHPTRNKRQASQGIKVFVSSNPTNTTSRPVLSLSSKLSDFVIDYQTKEKQFVKIEAKLERGEDVVVDATVTAIVISPENNGKEAIIQLLDDGMGSDVEKNDGVYSRYLSTVNLKPRLRYQVVVIANSIPEKTRFRHKTTISFVSLEINKDWTLCSQFERQSSVGSIKAINDYVPLPPSQVKDFHMTSMNWSTNIAELRWTGVGNNADSGVAAEYEIVGTCDQPFVLELEGDYWHTFTAFPVPGNNFVAKAAGIKEHVFVQISSSCKDKNSLFLSIRYLNKEGLYGPYSVVASPLNLLHFEMENDDHSSNISISVFGSLFAVVLIILGVYVGCRNRESLYSKVFSR